MDINNSRQPVADPLSCYRSAMQTDTDIMHDYLHTLGSERLEHKAADISMRLHSCNRDWEHTFFITLARAFGFGKNSDTAERWARSIPYNGIAKHRDNIVQVLAMMLGQAGFLVPDFQYADHISCVVEDATLATLRAEYKFLADKFSLIPIDNSAWQFAYIRPNNFPVVRVVQFARLYNSGNINLAAVIDASEVKEVQALFNKNKLSKYAVNLLIVNAVVPTLYAYGHYKGLPRLYQKARHWLNKLPAENNMYTRLWTQVALPLKNAADSQAILQLIKVRCKDRNCRSCPLKN